jgi:hypothetical protein
MNPFSMMMAASRACNKKEDLVPSKPVQLKRKVGRPPAAKLPEPAIVPFPVVDLTSLTTSTLSRRNYDVGDAKTRMDNALQIVIKSRGKHTRRTALTYNVSRKSLVLRFNAAMNSLADGPTGKRASY